MARHPPFLPRSFAPGASPAEMGGGMEGGGFGAGQGAPLATSNPVSTGAPVSAGSGDVHANQRAYGGTGASVSIGGGGFVTWIVVALILIAAIIAAVVAL